MNSKGKGEMKDWITGGGSGRKVTGPVVEPNRTAGPVEDTYSSVAGYDPVLRSHCRLEGAAVVFRRRGGSGRPNSVV